MTNNIIDFYDERIKIMIEKIIKNYIDILAVDANFNQEEQQLMIDNSVLYWKHRNATINNKIGGDCMKIKAKTKEDKKLLDSFVLETNSAHLKDVVLIQLLNGIDRYTKRTGLPV